MALIAPSREELLQLVRQFYAEGLDPYEPSYRDSPKFHALEDTRRRATGERRSAWSGLTHTFAMHHGRERVFDTTHFGLDACYRVRVYTESSTAADATAAVLMVSILAPVHAMYTVRERRDEHGGLPPEVWTGPRSETSALISELDLEASERMQSARVEWTVLETPVPWASTMHAELGKATLADLLLSDQRW